MVNFKSYMHVERLSSEDCEGLLDNNDVVVTAKVDATNACVWHDDTDSEQYRLRCGSRKREINPNDDNAGFAMWIDESDDDEVNCLRELCHDYPHFVVYGEWMAKFVGQIKDYNQDAKYHMYIFDVFDTEKGYYLPDIEWREILACYGLEPWFVEVLAVLDHPTMDDIVEVAKKNKFLLDNASHPGEGVVCKVAGWINKFGRQMYGKLVLDEYQQNKKVSKKVSLQPGEVEQMIVDTYCTDAEFAKTREKVVVACNAEEFDTKNPKHVGMYVNLCWSDLCNECGNWCKRYKNPIVDFGKLKGICQEKARKYVGL